MTYHKLPKENVLSSSYMFEAPFLEAIRYRMDTLPRMSNSEVAAALEDASDRQVYYHTELCEFLQAAVAEAARRLRRC
jgi:hypothetical protein